MLISFSVENFKSIRDLQTLSLEARAGDHMECSHTFAEAKHRLLKSAAIYGPNASGKSNVIEAMKWFRRFVLISSNESQAGVAIDIDPFRLSTTTDKEPTHFEVEFLWNGFHYRYGFEVSSERIHTEWLFRKSPGSKPARLFTREFQTIDVSSKFFKEGKGLEIRARENALFLSLCAQLNGDQSTAIMQWILRFRHVSGLSEFGFYAFTAERLQNPKHRARLLELAKQADFNIQSISSELEEVSEKHFPSSTSSEIRQRILSEKYMRADIKTTHARRNKSGKVVNQVEFDLQADESEGTQKFVALSGPITHTLEEGSILVVDELEARLHPRLTQAILDLFHGPVNRHNAQLICATHDVILMEPDRFRRDQIWFCEKDETGATDLYCLNDFDSNQVRPTSKFSRQYMLGLFGAVPKLAHFEEAAANATTD